MALAIVAGLPVHLPLDLNDSKKLVAMRIVAGIQSIIEECRHPLLMILPDYKAYFEELSARVHLINDVKVYDATICGEVSVQGSKDSQSLCLQKKPVEIPDATGSKKLLFSRAARIDYLVVKDGPKDGCFTITQVELNSNQQALERVWLVQLTAQH